MDNTAVQAAAETAKDIANGSRDRQARWDADHIRTASCRLTKEEYTALRRECHKQHITVYGLVRACLLAYLDEREVCAPWE